MDVVDALDHTFQHTQGVIAGTRASQYDDKTPCAEWTVRELLERNLVPFTWHDLEIDQESRGLLEGLGVDEADCPVLVRSDDVIRRATVASVASSTRMNEPVVRLRR